MRLTRPFLLASVALGVAACAGNAPPTEGPLVHTVYVEPLTTTHVVNSNVFPVTIYLTQAGMRHRLGVVESLSGASFLIPPRLLEGRKDFRLIASPLGPHPTYVSETFMIRPGQSADWRIQEASTPQAAVVSLVSVH